jgi:hypothetical protein
MRRGVAAAASSRLVFCTIFLIFFVFLFNEKTQHRLLFAYAVCCFFIFFIDDGRKLQQKNYTLNTHKPLRGLSLVGQVSPLLSGK